MEKLTISVDELATQLGISRPLAYELTRRDGFPAVRLGERRIVIPLDGLKRWLDSQSKAVF